MEADWDLQAVVRGCAGATTTATTSAAVTTTSCSQIFPTAFQKADCNFSTAASSSSSSSFQDLFFEPRRERELHDLYKPFFFPKSSSSPSSTVVNNLSPQSLPISPLSVLGGLPDLPPSDQQHQQQQIIMKQLPQQQIIQPPQKQQLFSVVANGPSKASVSHHPTPRSKRRKNNMKRVCHVAAENLSSDVWSWRKYGQKPIKGSPYPRGYYRCSTSKGCMARKQVERNRSDPGMFIVTYTAEHNHPMPTHRNSLAGSTRQKPPEKPTSDEPSKPSCSPEVSPAPEKLESSREDFAEEDDDDDFSVSKMALDDDFFVGLEDLTAASDTDGDLPASLQFPPWLTNGATTIAGGG